jgi:hypothetical protein
VTNEEITRAFMEKGWEIRYRGGNSKCTTPSDLDVIVADMPGSVSGESSTPWLEPTRSRGPSSSSMTPSETSR